MAVSKVVLQSGRTLIDLSGDTVTDASHIMSGYVGHLADGSKVTGTGGAAQAVYTGTEAPSASLGDEGDIYIQAEAGGSVEVYPADYESSGMSSTGNASACVGKSADDGSSTSNMYSSGQSTTGVVEYSFDLSSIPSGASVKSVSCRVKAHEENASRSTFTLQLYAGDTAKGSKTTVSGTSNTIYALTTGDWTRAELDSLVLHTEYGYYGGLVAGATLTVEYEIEGAEYDVKLTGSSSGWSVSGSGIYKKSGGSWTQAGSVELEKRIERKA